MKEHLKFAFKVAVALFIMNTLLSLLGSAGAQAKGFINNGIPLGGILPGSGTTAG